MAITHDNRVGENEEVIFEGHPKERWGISGDTKKPACV